ncbi:MAG TPA: hypothetical protein VF601_00625 [Beijerinckiaceae bacterium]|jgi:hypothetical protein
MLVQNFRFSLIWVGGTRLLADPPSLGSERQLAQRSNYEACFATLAQNQPCDPFVLPWAIHHGHSFWSMWCDRPTSQLDGYRAWRLGIPLAVRMPKRVRDIARRVDVKLEAFGWRHTEGLILTCIPRDGMELDDWLEEILRLRRGDQFVIADADPPTPTKLSELGRTLLKALTAMVAGGTEQGPSRSPFSLLTPCRIADDDWQLWDSEQVTKRVLKLGHHVGSVLPIPAPTNTAAAITLSGQSALILGRHASTRGRRWHKLSNQHRNLAYGIMQVMAHQELVRALGSSDDQEEVILPLSIHELAVASATALSRAHLGSRGTYRSALLRELAARESRSLSRLRLRLGLD